MKHDELPSFLRDWRRLSAEEQMLFRKAVREFAPACERFVRDRASSWPAGLRVKRVMGAPGIWEMTWSFAGPDGRATFEWIAIDGELAVRWRRIGGHEILERP